MPRRLKRTGPAAARKNLNLDKGSSPQPKKSMGDLPPEVVTIILEHLTRNVSRNDILGYRLVNSQWKQIINLLLERKITSGHLKAFPVMRIHPRDGNAREDILYVRHSTTTIPVDRNPFPSNSPLLYGNGGGITPNYLPDSIRDVKKMALADFMSTSGSYLTNLTLENVIVPGMNSLVTLLSSLSSLKVLRLETVYFDDRIIKPNLVFPTPPVLPNFTNLQVKHGESLTIPTQPEPGQLDEKRHILYVWLIVSYADQLLHLSIETDEQLPALQPRTQYFYSFPDKTTLPIATASVSAFRNLKELQIEHFHDNLNVIRDSELPNLQRISISDQPVDFVCDIEDLANFIRKCRTTLVHLRFDVRLDNMIEWEAELEGGLGLPIPKLKTLEMQYSPGDDRKDEIRISRFLLLFPALETLHILRFHSSNVTPAQELGTDVGNADEIVAAKSRLAALEHKLYERTMRYRQKRAAIPYRGPNRIGLVSTLNNKFYVFRSATYCEANEIFRKLAARGVKKQDVLMEQFLERQGIWNTCLNLKLVSVSSEGQPDGDLCILRRPVV